MIHNYHEVLIFQEYFVNFPQYFHSLFFLLYLLHQLYNVYLDFIEYFVNFGYQIFWQISYQHFDSVEHTSIYVD